MSQVKIEYYPSHVLDGGHAPIIKLMSVSGYDPQKFKFWHGEYERSHACGEICISYCITKNNYSVKKTLGEWRSSRASKDNKSFNDEIELLPYNNLYDYNGICFVLESSYIKDHTMRPMLLAAAILPLYNSKKVFRRGLYEVELHPLPPNIETLKDIDSLIPSPEFNGKPKSIPELNKLLKNNRKRIRDELPDIPMDRKSMPEIEKAIEQLKKDSGRMFLSITVDFSRSYKMNKPVIFSRKEMQLSAIDKRNPVDEKYVKISRNPRTADADKCRKPNTETIHRLREILFRPPNQDLSDVDTDMIWRYRFYLSKQFPEQALPKVLLAVKWEYSEQEKQADELMQQWPSIPPVNVLELLTSKFRVPLVRKFAVSKLKEETDENLLLYLFQLVQALRYENFQEILATQPVGQEITNASTNETSVYTGTDLVTSWNPADLGQDGLTSTPVTLSSQLSVLSRHTDDHATFYDDTSDTNDDLASFLVQRALRNFELTNYLFWFLKLEKDDDTPSSSEVKLVYKHVLARLSAALKHGNMENSMWRSDLRRQTGFVDHLCALMKTLVEDSSNRQQKIKMLRSKLMGPAYENLTNITTPFSLPLDPKFKVKKIEAETAFLFKSGMKPALLTLVSPTNEKYQVLFKHGDDLRQDQLVLQMIRFMDSILQKENLDLCLTPYKVLSTSCKHGFVQFVPSTSVSQIHSNMLGYLQEHAPSATDPFGVSAKVMENYIHSLAGYCVITYLLGVGDRHLENLMLTKEGHFFHIDFGWILGNDPKPMPPDIRLTQQMIEVMGGFNTQQCALFFNLTFHAFLTLRRYANLFLTLFSLVLDAGIQDIAREPNKACDFVKERFALTHSDEAAVLRIASKMNESVKAIMPNMIEKIHSVVQFMRN